MVILVCANILSTNSLVLSASLQQSQTEHRTTFLTGDKDQYPDGDPRRCDSSNVKRLRFEVLPGGGWDNLNNKEMGMVIAQNFTNCLTTEDGEFLIPDGVYTIPMKNSKVETFAELMEHWDNYTSTLSRTLNAEAGLSFSHVGIDAKFSTEYESIKSQQQNEKSMTTRVQARYVRYTAKLQPDSALNSVFRSRLRKIAACITLNQTENAKYESQLLVRDFGTHVITSVDAGVALVQIEQIRSTYVRKSESHKSTVLASASANFFDVFKFSTSFSQIANVSDVRDYLAQRTMSLVMTFGGPVFRPTNYSADQWSNFVDNDLVALDRSGDPIYFAITHKTLPDVPQSTVHDVRNYVKDAVYLYYKYNTYRGCTNPNSPNFNFQANVDDGSCQPKKSNFTFGGVYQECRGWGYTDLCPSMTQKNPLTGNYNCPSQYEAVLIHTGSKYSSETRHECHSCYLFFTCCTYKTYEAFAKYSAYWCSVQGQASENSGFLFGGLFTRTTINPLTQAMSCPSNFYQLTILDRLAICVSDDYELGYQYSLPFAGFYSCEAGNPLSLKEKSRLLKSGNKTSVLNSFLLVSGIQSYPRTCPEGYSQHLAVVDNGCEINYCVKFGSFTGLPKLQRPPFMDEPKDDTANSSYVLNNDGAVWLTMDEAMKEIPQYLHSHGADNQAAVIAAAQTDGMNKGGKSNTLTNGGLAAIFVSATLVCVIIASYIFVTIRRHRNVNGRVFDYSRSVNECKYGTTSTSNVPVMENTQCSKRSHLESK